MRMKLFSIKPNLLVLIRTDLIILVFLAILVSVFRWPSLEQPFENDSGATAYHARLIIRGEPLYGTHHPAHHMPGVFYTYALAFALFGDSVWAVKFFLLLWLIFTVNILYLLTSTIIDKPTGILAAILLSVLSIDEAFVGSAAKLEQFANLPRIAAILVLIKLMDNRSAPWKYLFVGLLSAIAFLYKAVYFSPLAIGGIVLVGDYLSHRGTPGKAKAVLVRGLWMSVGFISGLLPALIYFGYSGLLPRFLQVFTMGQKYIHVLTNDSPVILAILFPLFWLVFRNTFLTIYFLGGIYFLFRHRNNKYRKYLLIALLWFALSYIEAIASLTGLFHYYIPLLPPLAIFTAWFLIDLSRNIRNNLGNKHQTLSMIFSVILILSAFSQYAYHNFDTYYYYYRYKAFQDSYDFPNGYPIYIQDVSTYIQEHTSPEDYIYIWSDDIQIYYLTDRRSPIATIWPLFSEATGPYSRIFEPRTTYIILGKIHFEFFPPWLYQELGEKYRLETIIHGQRIYRRIE
jgi:hypothetical protein